jgi:general stress protein CsbA
MKNLLGVLCFLGSVVLLVITFIQAIKTNYETNDTLIIIGVILPVVGYILLSGNKKKEPSSS